MNGELCQRNALILTQQVCCILNSIAQAGTISGLQQGGGKDAALKGVAPCAANVAGTQKRPVAAQRGGIEGMSREG